MSLKYYLILNVQYQSGFYGGVGAGSISAHWLHLEMLRRKYSNDYSQIGVFFNLNPPNAGFPGTRNSWDSILKTFGKTHSSKGRKFIISNTGFFYEADQKAITTRFKAKGYYTYPEAVREGITDFLPPFQLEYINTSKKDKEERERALKKRSWLLVSNIEKLKHPVYSNPITKSILGFKIRRKTDGRSVNYKPYFHGAWAYSIPMNANEVRKFNIFEEESRFLKSVLTSGESNNKLKELNLQNILKFSLAKEGYWIECERYVKSGRVDLLFKDCKNRLTAIEIKLNQADKETCKQLKSYINSLKKEATYRGKTIRGVIICGEASEKIKAEAKKHFGFDVIPYHLAMKINI